MTYLVDTDYIADYLKGYKAATTLLNSLLPQGISISIITFAEAYEGIYYGQNRLQHEHGFRQLVKTIPVVTITRSVALQFARIRGELRAKGLLIPDPDLYIAATALQHNLTLVTRNLKDYERVPHLKLYE
jgi:tRNA(fMet)-specific endonuclease VapC